MSSFLPRSVRAGSPKVPCARRWCGISKASPTWRTEFAAIGKALRGGSGWVLLSWSPRDQKLVNQWAMDHTTTLAGGQPILVLDMYEHSYHLDYGAQAAAYVDAFMAAINWPNVARIFAGLPSATT